MNENIPQQPQVFAVQRPESGTVTALAVVSIIFGTIGLLGSFIPCLGAFAIWIAIPSALFGAGATYMAKSKGCSIGLPVASFIVSTLGVIIASVQIIAISGAAKAANDGIQALDAEMKQERKYRQEEQSQNQPSPAPPPQDPESEDVREFLASYFRLWSEKQMDAYADLFDPGATVHFVAEGGKVIPWPVPPFIESQRRAHAAATAPMVETTERTEVYLSPDGKAAQAAVKWKLVEGNKVTFGWDHFTLLRRDQRWYILNLVFYKE